MCGLTGIFDPVRRDPIALTADIGAMTSTLRHRGPDSGNVWIEDESVLALGHRRLAIIDLSPEGCQPMRSASGRYVIAFNGEVYNFAALRAELAALGHSFFSRSDTEVLLAGIERYGLENALSRIAGMYAFALWDRRDHRLHLVRDRIGKKPLYYGWAGGALVFASELKAIAAHPRFKPEIDRNALTAYLRYQYVPAPWSIWQGIYKLPPGCRLSISLSEFAALDPAGLPALALPYWSMKDIAERNSAQPFAGPPKSALDRLETTLRQAVSERMTADVPLGAFLSGGIDSSLIVAMMQEQSAQPVKTFTIGFNEGFYDEAAAARQVARHLGTDHTEFTVTADDARAIIPDLPQIYDEPFADPSAVPTAHIARLARTKVTVCLSGDGGDEVFAGYGRYALASRLGRGIDRFPRWVRGIAGRGIAGVPVSLWDAAFRSLSPRALPGLRGGLSGDRMHKLAELMNVGCRDELYHALMSLTRTPQALVRGGAEPLTAFTDPAWAAALSNPLQHMMYCDTVTYLPDDILVKVDRASMAVGLEVRSPLLDHRVIELAWRLPHAMLRQDGDGKWPLRQLFDRHLPPAFRDRPKQGFAIPVADWLRGPLRDWADDLFDTGRMEADGLLDPAPIRRMWAEHLSGARNWGAQLWTIAMFQAWRRRWLGSGSGTASAQLDRAEAA